MIRQSSQLHILQSQALIKAIGMTTSVKKNLKTGLHHSMTAVMVLRHLSLLDNFFSVIFAPEYFVALSILMSTHTTHLSAATRFHILTPWKVAELHQLPAFCIDLNPLASPSFLLRIFLGATSFCSQNCPFQMLRYDFKCFSTEHLRLTHRHFSTFFF